MSCALSVKVSNACFYQRHRWKLQKQITTCVKKSRRCGLEHSVLSTCFLQLHAYMGERLQASPLGEGLG